MRRPAAAWLTALLLACSSQATSGAAGVQSLWVAPASLDALSDVHVYDHPWPSDLRRDADGTIHVDGFYNPMDSVLIAQDVASLKGLLDGFSPVAAAYLRFTGDIDPASLPADPPHTLDPSASVQLIDVDPASPEHGKRRMVETFWQQADGVYWLKDTLAVLPALGYPLLPGTKYALVVTSALRAPDGTPVTPGADLAEVLDLAPVEARVRAAHDLYSPAVADLASLGIPPKSIVHLAVFTTNDPTADLFSIVDTVRASVPAPAADPTMWTAAEQTTDYDVYEGEYGPSPVYQQGTPPYAQAGGNFVFSGGKPVEQGSFNLRFCLVVPNAKACPMPAAGYPIVLYAHGTGGNYRSIVDENNSFGDLVAQHCLASMGIDQIFHGTRPGAPPANDPNYETDVSLLFFNLNNPAAARTNGPESAVDVVQQARLFTEAHLTVPASVSRTSAQIAFDGTDILFIGHSQGGINGPMFLAADGQARGGVLSGSAAMITVSLLEKTQPQPSVASAVKLLLGLTNPGDAAELNLFHPVLNLAQTIVDPSDPIHYERYIVQSPRSGQSPKSILQTEGVNPDGTGDSYAPPHGIEIASVALGLPREMPGVHPILEASWSGALGDVSVPPAGLAGNLAGGLASGVLGQFTPAPNYDGHFVAFDVPAAHAQVGGFCANLASDPHGRVPPLPP
jgi:hypothetical protein